MPELHPASCLVCWELLLLWASTQRSGGSVTMQLGGAQLWLRKGWWLHLPILKLYLKVGEVTKGCCYCFWRFFSKPINGVKKDGMEVNGGTKTLVPTVRQPQFPLLNTEAQMCWQMISFNGKQRNETCSLTAVGFTNIHNYVACMCECGMLWEQVPAVVLLVCEFLIFFRWHPLSASLGNNCPI